MFEYKPFIRKANYYETDQMAIVHHSNYIRWMEEARVDLMDQIGFPLSRLEAEGIVIPVLMVEAEYKSMVKFDETVVIKITTEKYDGIRLYLNYEISNKETGQLRTLCKSGHCFLNDKGRPISLKKVCPEIHEKFVDTLELLK